MVGAKPYARTRNKMDTIITSQCSPAEPGGRSAPAIRRFAAAVFTAAVMIAPAGVVADGLHAALATDRQAATAHLVLTSASNSTSSTAPDTQAAPCPGAYYCSLPGTDPSVPYGPDPMVPYGPDPLASVPGPHDLAS